MSRPAPQQQQQPQYTIAKPGGVLPMPSVGTPANSQTNGVTQKTTNKSPPQKLKTVVRRLPPGLTEQEFEAALGEEWKAGQGRIAWAQYRPGKVSRDQSKPSRPARAYLQVVQQSYLDQLADVIKGTTFADGRKTDNDPVLLGPPVLEFAPHGRVPFGRKRHDARQGLIDQDPEFIQFLESLTNPVTKPTQVDDASEQPKDDAKKITPLIKHLREKKAAKEAAKRVSEDKEKASSAKAGKHSRPVPKNDKEEVIATTPPVQQKATVAVAPAEKKGARLGKAERVAKSGSKQAKKESTPVEAKAPPVPTTAVQSPKVAQVSPAKRPEGPGPGSAAARMIQRDLGIRGGRGSSVRRGGRQGPVNGTTVGTATSTVTQANGVTGQSNVSTVQENQTPKAPSAPRSRVTSPKPTTRQAPVTVSATTQAGSSAVSSAQNASAVKAPPTGPAPKVLSKNPSNTTAARPNNKPLSNPTSTQAFLKHANPSQGITVALLEEAFKVFGELSKVDIDMRKGFAYVDFRDPEGLQKAMAASPIKVAQGTVQVLERKERASAPPTGPAAATLGSVRGAPTMQSPRGGPANFGVGFRGARAARGGRGGSMRGGPAVSAVGAGSDPVYAAPAETVPSVPADGPVSSATGTVLSTTSVTSVTDQPNTGIDSAHAKPDTGSMPAADAVPSTHLMTSNVVSPT